jgi:hypothetical protein
MEDSMITRTWHGIVPLEKAGAFRVYLDQTGVKDARAIAGNLGAYVCTVSQNEYVHFFLCTIWSGWDDIELYAGSRSSEAITYPEDATFGLISDPIVIHQEVNVACNPFSE